MMINENEYLRKILFTDSERDEFIGIKILSVGEKTAPIPSVSGAAVFVHLYYEELISFCLEYLRLIPADVDRYISVVSKEMMEKINSHMKANENQKVKIIIKENRGRDISSLLVTFREEIIKYKYACFIHDKWISGNNTREDTEIWLKTIWDNVLRNEAYILNLLGYLDKNKMVGLLIPPAPYGGNLIYAFDDVWGTNYERVINLADELGIDYNIKPNSKACSISTAFWCRTDALDKLFAKEWRYHDFPEEPLPVDGTLNHAVERILPYAAFAAGYRVMTVMNDEYAARLCENSYQLLRLSFRELNRISIDSIGRLISNQTRAENVRRYAADRGKIYIYGAGKRGAECYASLIGAANVEILGFIVSDGQKALNNFHLSPIYELSEIKGELSGEGLIIALSDNNAKTVLPLLKSNGIEDFILY